MRKKIILLGSTGSIGCSTIEILKDYPDEFELTGISAYSNIDLLKEQIAGFNPKAACIGNGEVSDLSGFVKNGCKCYSGPDGIRAMVRETEADILVNSIVGAAGLLPTLDGIATGKNIALANKESLVVAGELVIAEMRKHDVELFPVDSEHSAIWQCLAGEDKNNIKKLLLTASGGPFLNRKKETFESITLKEALNHPTWNMGNKITIDSSTLMNKGFEVIEAHWLFQIPPDRINVMIHPQSIVHSMVEFIDGSIKAQLGTPDMKLPIQYALTYPDRKPGKLKNDWVGSSINLTFDQPDYEQFPCLKLAFNALESGGTFPAVLNAANEVAVNGFLNNNVRFVDISILIDKALQEHKVEKKPGLEDYLEADNWARQVTLKRIRTNGI